MQSKYKKTIYQIISKCLGLKNNVVKDNTSLLELTRWDSLTKMRILIEIEKTLKFKININKIENIKNPSEILKIINKIKD